MVWTKSKILEALRRLHQSNKDLSYNALAKRTQPLVSAAAYHFGSYRKAVEKAGIDYAEVSRRPRWTKATIIALIKKARRNDQDLHWSSVTRRRDELGRAAFASLQKRLFGRWDRALAAAGLDADEVSRYRRWDRNTIVRELKELSRDGQALNSGELQSTDAGLHAAAVRHFESYDNALLAAKLSPNIIRRRRSWTRQDVIAALKAANKAGNSLSDTSIRKESPALYGAAIRVFGTYTEARKAAGIQFSKSR